MKKYFLLSFVALTLIACSKTKKQEQREEKKSQKEESVDHHTAQNSLDWAGEYKGIIPCADCPGIEMTVKIGQDQSIEIKSVYQSRDTEFIEDSDFEWLEDGMRIHSQVDEQNYYFRIEENRIVYLDKEGDKINSDLNYTLEKVTDEN